jgi:outer membrane lipoprotein SlyB
MAALAGVGVGAAAGGLAGALIGMGIPEYEAKRYEGRVKDGNILMSVHTTDSTQRDRAKQILIDGGAEDISYTGEASVSGEKKAAPAMGRYN